MSDALLELSGVETRYGLSQVLFGVSLAVGRGEFVTLMGRNGMGKTTTVRSIMGLTPARAGSIRFDGNEVRGLPSYRIAQRGIGLVPEGRQILGDLSVQENLQLGELALGGRSATWSYDKVVDLFPVLGKRQEQRAGSLSGGEQQMLAIGRALMGAPEMLLLDEPSLGLAPIIVDQVFAVLKQLNEAGLTILLVEQNARRALGVASRAYILERGKVVREGSAAEIAADPQVVSYYLGNLAEEQGAA